MSRDVAKTLFMQLMLRCLRTTRAFSTRSLALNAITNSTLEAKYASKLKAKMEE